MRILPTTTALALWLVVGACRDEPAAAAPQTSTAVEVKVARAHLGTLNPVLELIGTLDLIPERTALVAARRAGPVQKVHVVEGDAVRAGDPLVEFDPRATESLLASARATLSQREAARDRLRAGPRPQEVEAARQTVKNFEAAVDLAQSRAEAVRTLLEKKEASQVQYHAAAATLAQAEASLGEARARLDLLEAGTRTEEIEEAEAQLAAARADLTRVELDREFCLLRSPLDGRVIQLTVRQGQYLDRGVQIGTVADVSTLFATFRVPGAFLSQVAPGSPVEVRADAYPDQVFEGSVTRLSPRVGIATGEVIAMASLSNGHELLRPGMAVRVLLRLSTLEDVLVIPEAAVADRMGTTVVTLVRNGTAHEIPVRLGAETPSEVQVLEGLDPGDLVAVEGGYGLPEGCPVRFANDEEATGAEAPAR